MNIRTDKGDITLWETETGWNYKTPSGLTSGESFDRLDDALYEALVEEELNPEEHGFLPDEPDEDGSGDEDEDEDENDIEA